MKRAVRSTRRLAVERLEGREVPTASVVNGVLTVRGTDFDDSITINRIAIPGTVFVQVNENGQVSEFPSFQVRRVRVFGNGGHDDITHNVGGLNAALFGGAGDDRIYADDGNDYVNGGAGYDTLYGWGGNDTLVGGVQNDNLYGGPGNDALHGGAGNDWMDAGSRPELAVGGPGWDTNAYIWVRNGTRPTDINQGIALTCVFLSSLAGVAHTGLMDLGSQISYLGNDTYTVRLFVNGFWQDIEVKYNGSFTMDANGTYDSGGDQEGESWVLLYQRAYMRAIGYNPYSTASMASFEGEANGNRALTMISGWASQTALIDATLTPETLRGLVRGGYAVNGMFSAHEYAFTNVFQSGGAWYVRIYNPWGWDGVQGTGLRPLADGVNDGFMTITWTNFMATFFKYSWA